MKIFLTGGTGFIGSHFVNQAHRAGHEIIALRRSASSLPRIPLQRQPVWINKAMTELAAEDFAACEALVHLAAYSANMPYDTLPNCIRPDLDIFENLEKYLADGIEFLPSSWAAIRRCRCSLPILKTENNQAE